MKYGLTYGDISLITSVLAKQPNVEEAILFGSRAMGNFKQGSDIDLAIKGRNIALKDVLNLSVDLEDLGLLYKFDLQNFNNIKDEEVLAHIKRVGLVFYENKKRV